MSELATEQSYRKKLIKFVTFLAGVYFFVEFLLPKALLEAIGVAPYHSNISTGFIVVGSMAIGLGIINLFRVHGTRVVFLRKDWPFSFTLLLGLVLMMTVTTFDWLAGRQVTEQNARYRTLGQFAEVIVSDIEEKKQGVPERAFRVEKLVEAAQVIAKETGVNTDRVASLVPAGLIELDRLRFEELITKLRDSLEAVTSTTAADLSSDEALKAYGKQLTDTGVLYEKVLRHEYDQSTVKKGFSFLFEGFFVSLGSAMFSLLGVYIASAAYRAFRVKSVESFLMMTAAIVVMLGQIPFYEYISYELPAIRQWLLEIPNSAAFRAIKIGAAIAGLIMAFRMWFSIESESFSPKEAGKK